MRVIKFKWFLMDGYEEEVWREDPKRSEERVWREGLLNEESSLKIANCFELFGGLSGCFVSRKFIASRIETLKI